MRIEEKVRRIVNSNYWLSGRADFEDGDPFAGLELREAMLKVEEVDDLQKLYRLLRNYDGAFKYKNLIFFNSWKYGCFVYDLNRPDTYVEHLTIDVISLPRFREIVESLRGMDYAYA